MTEAIVAAVAGGGVPDLFQDPIWQDEEEAIMDLVTGSQFSQVGQSSRSGTCASVAQRVPGVVPTTLARKPQLCVQSVPTGLPFLPIFPASPALRDIQYNVSASFFVDEDFPATTSSLYSGTSRPDYLPEGIAWLRPSALVSVPSLVTEGRTRFDINQGCLGDCWFLAAVSTLTSKPEVMDIVIPPGQVLDCNSEEYTGAVRFQFFVRGEWKEMVVDDMLPTLNKKLIFLASDDPNEFWPALLEKAFAKLHESYHSLNGGTFAEASAYFGAITENFNIRGPVMEGLDPVYVRERLLEAGARGSLCGAAIYALGGQRFMEDQLKLGLPAGHAYSLTHFYHDKVCVRNPWGNDVEWVEQESAEDGEFLMPWPAFLSTFHQVQVAHYSFPAGPARDIPDTAGPARDIPDTAWTGRGYTGAWTSTTAGGCPNYSSFFQNCQHQVSVVGEEEGPVVLLVSLDQVHPARQELGLEKLPIGFHIFQTRPDGEPLTQQNFQNWVADSGIYRYQKQVVGRYLIPPGTYTIVPSTFYPGHTADYYLRVLYTNNTHLHPAQ